MKKKKASWGSTFQSGTHFKYPMAR